MVDEARNLVSHVHMDGVRIVTINVSINSVSIIGASIVTASIVETFSSRAFYIPTIDLALHCQSGVNRATRPVSGEWITPWRNPVRIPTARFFGFANEALTEGWPSSLR